MTPLKRARLFSSKRQIDIFNEIGIWPARLSMLENGLMKPNEHELQLLARVYKTRPEQLLDDHQEETKN